MKKFIINSIIFFGIPLTIFISVFLINKADVDNRFHDIAKNNRYIIMGDSEMQRINPKYFSEKTYNFGSSAEHYYFTYSKLKKLLSNSDRTFETVVIGASVQNFAPVYQRLYQFKYTEGLGSFKRYLYFLDIQDSMSYSIKQIITQKDLYISMFKSPDWGGLFESSQKSPDKKVIETVIDIHYYQKPDLDLTKQLHFFNKIVDLCRDNNIKLVALSTPVHQEYIKRVPKVYKDTLISIIQSRNIQHINLLNENISDTLVSDGNHLNIEGAKLYSKIIARQLDSIVNK